MLTLEKMNLIMILIFFMAIIWITGYYYQSLSKSFGDTIKTVSFLNTHKFLERELNKMVKKAKKIVRTKVKKKIWVPVLAPKLFNEKIIAEMPLIDASMAVGKVLSSNMMNLSGEIRAQSINAKLLITDLKEGKAYSKIIRYEISSPAIKRLVRRKRDRIDESLVYKAKDGVKLRIKPFILTFNHAKGSTRTEIRKRLKLAIYKTIIRIPSEEVFTIVIKNKLQREIKSTLSKLFPVRNCEIRVMHIEKNSARITPAPVFKEKSISSDKKDIEKDENNTKENKKSMIEEKSEESEIKK